MSFTRSLIPEFGSRFIPISSSSSVYKICSNNTENLNLKSPINISLREDLLFNHSSDESSSSVWQHINSSDSSYLSLKSPDYDLHQEIVAEALDFKHGSKVLKFTNNTKNDITDNLKKLKSPKISINNVKNIMASDILQAPGLRNDYYSNLVSWSQKTNRVAVGLSNKIYLWGVDNNVLQVDYNTEDLITAISCSKEFWILVSTSNGKILLIDQENGNNTDSEFLLPNGKCIFCFVWFNDSNYFIAGDDVGEVYIFKIHKLFTTEIVLIKSFKCHQQQICGFALNSNNDEVAIGANDNCCTIWNIKDLKNPKLKFVLPHNAAIKALNYCPWTNSLLATGGGSKDRKIRFWHTASGTLINEFYTDGQITSLIWSKYKKEIVATFGFGGTALKSQLIKVYSYPDMITTIEVNANCNLRILSATSSPDYCSICVATNDSTIRIYEIWEKTIEISPNSISKISGCYGSEIIELVEGIAKKSDVIR
ncbi:unnamed protein product [Candida verbasci]|uniref:CDC20/Fizzy WD40 domain-containing protein n=1 Tax=Candida verbasci TaxID=1227364 RepID=A0A9W4XAM4_9ASCO|nr:unnamed protein product [Candida verbasci]